MATHELHDGRHVDSASEDWRLESIALYVLKLPTLERRRAWLASAEPRLVAKLKPRMQAIFNARKKQREESK